MKNLRLALAVVLVLAPVSVACAADTPVDPGIKQACLDYVEGWFTGDVERMDRALHPDLAKRLATTEKETGEPRLVQLTKAVMMDYTARGGGKDVPESEWKIAVHVLDVYRNSATARVDSGPFVDFVHLAKWDGKWVIVNVLWENRPRE